MEAEVLSKSDLVSIPPADAFALQIKEGRALDFFTKPGAVDPVLSVIRAQVDAFKGDVSTAKGRKEIASMAFKLSQSKTYLEGVGKKLADEQKDIPRKIDAARKKIRDTFDAWRDEVRKPLNDWEAAEEKRIQRHNEAVNALEHVDVDRSSAELKAELERVGAVVIGPECEEFEVAYARAKDGAISKLLTAIRLAEKREHDAAELARLRAEEAERKAREEQERLAKEAEEKAKRDAEEQERREKEAAEKARADAEAAAAAREEQLRREKEEAERRAHEAEEKAKRDLEEAEAKAKRDAEEAAARAKREAEEAAAEAQRKADEQRRREEDEARRREESKRHRTKVHNAVGAALIAGGLSEDAAKLAVGLIAAGKVPHVAITY